MRELKGFASFIAAAAAIVVGPRLSPFAVVSLYSPLVTAPRVLAAVLLVLPTRRAELWLVL
ncbi:uncharacterized protein DS421_4g125400 [Arachis hypogaea]|nr:uncharacterized protein DS421_4g125400 [Arachis hypogaea]